MGTKERLGGILKGAARILPGIGSYQDKESLRQSDKKLREFLGSQISGYMKTIEGLKADISRRGSLSFLRELDDITRRMDTLSRSLRFASRGYAPVFDSDQVGEDALQKLFQFDQSLKQDIDHADPLVSKISEMSESLDPVPLKELDEILLRIQKRIDEREHLLKK